MTEITGEVKFRANAPESIPSNSHLTVKFEDVSLMDAPSVKLGETEGASGKTGNRNPE